MFVLYGGEVWDEKYFNKQCFSHVMLREEILNAEIAAHLENEQRKRKEKYEEELCHEYW